MAISCCAGDRQSFVVDRQQNHEAAARIWSDRPAHQSPLHPDDFQGFPIFSGGVRLIPAWRPARGRRSLPTSTSHLLLYCRHGNGSLSGPAAPDTPSRVFREGSLIVVPAGMTTELHLGDRTEFACLYVPDSRLRRVATEWHETPPASLGLRPMILEDGPAHLMARLSASVTMRTAESATLADPCLDLLCVALLNRHAAGNVVALNGGLARWRFRRVEAYVMANLSMPLRLSDLAREAGLSPHHFCTAFRRARGETPGNWLAGLRIARAAELLSRSERSVTDIALDVGYETPSAFAAGFRKRIGLTPTEFRARRR
jgi:AraC family transcriptional regulator